MQENMSDLIKISRRNKIVAYLKEKGKKLGIKRINAAKDAWAANKDEKNFTELLNRYSLYPSQGTMLNKKICLMLPKDSLTYKAALKANSFFKSKIDMIDPFAKKWSVNKIKEEYDGVIYRPEFKSNYLRQVSNDHIELLELFNIPVWPNKQENYLYESKCRASQYLESLNIPTPKTIVKYTEAGAIECLQQMDFPFIIKTNTGASSSGVFLIKNKKEAYKSIRYLFANGFLRQGAYRRDLDYGYIYLQEFIPDVREYRIIKVGESWFGHEKLGKDGSVLYSGSGVNSWEIPSKSVFEFCYNIAHSNKFNVMSFDVFETKCGKLLINELQTWFGSYNPSQMYKDGIPGRFIKQEDEWRFEEGIFNYNQGLNLRIFEFDRYLNDIEGAGKQ